MPDITYFLYRDEEEYDLLIDFTITPYDPGNTYGPPENCYPPEGGEIYDLTAFLDGREFSLLDGELEKIEQYIHDNFVDFGDDYDDPY